MTALFESLLEISAKPIVFPGGFGQIREDISPGSTHRRAEGRSTTPFGRVVPGCVGMAGPVTLGRKVGSCLAASKR